MELSTTNVIRRNLVECSDTLYYETVVFMAVIVQANCNKSKLNSF